MKALGLAVPDKRIIPLEERAERRPALSQKPLNVIFRGDNPHFCLARSCNTSFLKAALVTDRSFRLAARV